MAVDRFDLMAADLLGLPLPPLPDVPVWIVHRPTIPTEDVGLASFQAATVWRQLAAEIERKELT